MYRSTVTAPGASVIGVEPPTLSQCLFPAGRRYYSQGVSTLHAALAGAAGFFHLSGFERSRTGFRDTRFIRRVSGPKFVRLQHGPTGKKKDAAVVNFPPGKPGTEQLTGVDPRSRVKVNCVGMTGAGFSCIGLRC